jgi:uncharacterized protein involved in exopolysaccharide biosynthesis
LALNTNPPSAASGEPLSGGSRRSGPISLQRLIRILWSRRLLVLVPTVCALIGGVVVILTFPPRYAASTRVILDLVKPDPVTGFVVDDKMRDAYISSEINMLRSDEVTGRVVEAIGWLEAPDLIAAWQAAPDKGDSLKRWAGRRLSYGIGGNLVEDTNILKISFVSTSPDLAKLVADNLRTAFIEASVAETRDSARGSATNLSAQAERERERLVQLQALKADLERKTGFIMVGESGMTDADVHALQAARMHSPMATGGSGVRRDDAAALEAQLQNIDSSIVAAGHTLGPNNPIMVEMHRRRDFVAAQLAGAKPADPVADMTMRRLEAVTALARQSSDRLTTTSDKRLALGLVQDEITRRTALFNKVAKRAGVELEVSNVSDANLTPIGGTIIEGQVFPNLPLIVGGCGALGLAIGILLSLILEAMGRRVRGPAEMRTAIEAPMIGVMPAISWAREPRPKIEKARPPKPVRGPKAGRGKARLAQA